MPKKLTPRMDNKAMIVLDYLLNQSPSVVEKKIIVRDLGAQGLTGQDCSDTLDILEDLKLVEHPQYKFWRAAA